MTTVKTKKAIRSIAKPQKENQRLSIFEVSVELRAVTRVLLSLTLYSKSKTNIIFYSVLAYRVEELLAKRIVDSDFSDTFDDRTDDERLEILNQAVLELLNREYLFSIRIWEGTDPPQAQDRLTVARILRHFGH